MTKTLITHINPHLDDIAALWLFKKFHPEFSNAEIKFVSAAKGNLPADESEDQIYLGVGRGKYDEHKGDLEDAAVSLVWKDLKSQGFVPETEEATKALEELVDFIRLDDLGKLKDLKYPEFSLPGFIRIGGGEEDSIKNTELGFEILNRIFKILINKQKAQKEWEGAIELETKWGKGYAVKGTYVNRSFCDLQDGQVYLMVDPTHKAVQFYTPNDNVDLEPIYSRVKELDPEASWFLHQSHKMVICGSGSAPDSNPTKLSFEQLKEILELAA